MFMLVQDYKLLVAIVKAVWTIFDVLFIDVIVDAADPARAASVILVLVSSGNANGTLMFDDWWYPYWTIISQLKRQIILELEWTIIGFFYFYFVWS